MHERTLFEALENRILFSASLETGFGDVGVDPGRLVASALISTADAGAEISPVLGAVDLLDIATYPAPDAS